MKSSSPALTRAFRSLLVSLSLAISAQADTIYFDNSSSPVISGSFISAAVSQVVRFKTDTFSSPENLSYVDVWLNQFTANNGALPNVAIYNDASGGLGSLLTSAQVTGPISTSYTPHQVRVDFSGAYALASDTYYWIGMNFSPGTTNSLAWGTSFQSEPTTLAFITAGGVNYVRTNNMPNVRIVGVSAAAVPESGGVALFLTSGLGVIALCRAMLRKSGKYPLRA